MEHFTSSLGMRYIIINISLIGVLSDADNSTIKLMLNKCIIRNIAFYLIIAKQLQPNSTVFRFNTEFIQRS